MRLLCLPLVLVLSAAGQEKPADKPDPVKKARELLDSAAEMVAGVDPKLQVPALWHLAENYQSFDRKKAIEYYRQAWAGAPTLPPDQMQYFDRRIQAEIVRSAADVDPELAMEMALQMATPGANESYDQRLFATVKIAQVLIVKREFAKALSFLEAMGGKGAYSFLAASALFAALPPDDPRRQSLFGNAQAAFNLRASRDFSTLLARHWQDLPPNVASAALSSYLSFVLDRKEEGKGYETITYATAKGTASFNTPQERELFDVMWLVREIEPKRAEEILLKYPALKAGLEAYPKGTRSMQAEGAFYTFTTTSDQKDARSQAFAEQFRMRAMMAARSEEVMQMALKDPDRGLEMVRSIGSPAKQAEVLAVIARGVGEKDAAKSRGVLAKCMEAIGEVKDPGERMAPLDAVAEAAGMIHEDKLVEEALGRSLTAADELRKWESEDYAHVPEEFRVSMQAYRRIVTRAVRVYGTDAEQMLAKIGDPGVNLMARIALAQALLGRGPKMWPPYTPLRRRTAKQ